MGLFDKEEVAAPSVEAAIQTVVAPVATPPAAPVATPPAAPVATPPAAPVADATTDYWATAWANRGV